MSSKAIFRLGATHLAECTRTIMTIVSEPTLQADLFTGISNSRFLEDQIITYIGNKRALLDFIGVGIRKAKTRLGKDRIRTIDVFSGSGIVSRFLKMHSSYLHSNDLERYAEVVNRCYLTNLEEIDQVAIEDALMYINDEASKNTEPGFISELYAPEDDNYIRKGERVFYTARNARFIDTARKLIDTFNTDLREYLLAPLLYKASVHANTSGVFKGFYKDSATGIGQFGGNGKNALTRILGDIHIPMPVFSGFSCNFRVTRGDANEIVKEVDVGNFDVAYVDPPYNQHPYGSNYFMLNLIADYVRPDNISKVSGIPIEWNRSDYNKRNKAEHAFIELIDNLDAKLILISFNSEGFITKESMLRLLERSGRVETISTQYNTFRGSRNLGGRDRYVTEFLYLLEKF